MHALPTAPPHRGRPHGSDARRQTDHRPPLVADIKGVHMMIDCCAEILGKPPVNEEAPDVGTPTERTSHEPPIR
jgi:hypothetical protein